MNDLAAGALNYSTHNIDGSVVPVEKTGSGNNSNFVNGSIGSDSVHDCKLNQVAANLLALRSTSYKNFRNRIVPFSSNSSY